MFFEKICAQSLDKNYAYLKLCSSEPNSAFTLPKPGARNAQSWLCKKRQEGENRRRQEANYKLFYSRLAKSIAKSKKYGAIA